jgi:hypothetical protein
VSGLIGLKSSVQRGIGLVALQADSSPKVRHNRNSFTRMLKIPCLLFTFNRVFELLYSEYRKRESKPKADAD